MRLGLCLAPHSAPRHTKSSSELQIAKRRLQYAGAPGRTEPPVRASSEPGEGLGRDGQNSERFAAGDQQLSAGGEGLGLGGGGQSLG